MQITLTPEQEDLVRRGLASGRFATADEAMQLAFELLRDEVEAEDVPRLREQIASGLAAAERGEFTSRESVRTRLLEHREAHQRRS